MTSIRLKLTLGAALLFAGGIGILLAAMSASPGDEPSLTRAAKGLGSGTGYKIVVADRDDMVRVSSAPEFQEGQVFPLPKDQLEYLLARREGLERGAPSFGILDAAPRGQTVIQLVAGMPAGRFLVITQPLEQLRRNIAIASRFFLFVGSLVLVFVFAAVLLLSGRMARPILEVSAVARRVAAGDYGARCLRARDDELGALGDSLNAMAAALAKSIQDLTAANRELALKVKAQEGFIAGASHELKTPVGLVRGYAEALKLGMFSSDAERDELAEGDLFETLSKAVSRFARAAAEKRVALGLEGRGPIAASFDPDRVVQVMDNLLSNGLRHAPEGGTIEVRVEPRAREVCVEVENSGVGVPEKDLPSLFEPFYRADASRTRSSGGSGLGLAVVRSVVEAHGGSCGARNTAKGFLAWVSLPRRGAGGE